jgi:2-dehydropantoate 2-reductase
VTPVPGTYQCAEMHRIAFGLGMEFAIADHPRVYALSASAFMGLPWPKKIAGSVMQGFLHTARMKVCIYGAGAIGGLIGARLAARGDADVAVVARGETLKAIREHGLRLKMDGTVLAPRVQACDDPAALGAQDLVVIAVKGPALPEIASRVAPLLAPGTVVLPAMNGVPWWFFEGLAGPCQGMRIEAVDPGGSVSRAIPADHVLGCVVHISASAVSPGFVAHGKGNGLIVGEPRGETTARLVKVVSLLADAGFEVTQSKRIQYDTWYKLLGNLTMNPVSAITGATADRVLDDPLVRDFCRAAMVEARRIGEKIGCPIAETPEERQAVARKLGAFKTSMLQDVEAGKPLEIDAIVAAVREIGERVDIATPNIDALLGLVRLFGETRGLYRRPGA